MQSFFFHALSVVYFAFAIRILSVDEVGIVSVLGMIASLALTTFTFAIPTGVTWYVSGSNRNGLNAARPTIIKCIAFGFLVSVSITFFTYIMAEPLATILFRTTNLGVYIRLFSLTLFASILSPFFASILYGLRKYKTIFINNVLSTMLRYGLSIVLLLNGLGIVGVIYAWALGELTNLMLNAASSFRGFVATTRMTHFNSYGLTRLLRYSIPIYGANLLVYMTLYLERYFLLVLGNLSYVAYFSVAMAGYAFLGSIGDSLSSSLFPKLAEMHSYNFDLSEAVKRGSRYLFLLYIPMAVGLATLAHPLVLLLGGGAYEAAVTPLAIITVTSGVTCFIRVVDPSILAIGKTKLALEARSLAIVVSAGVLFVSIPTMGLNGAAIGKLALILVYVAYTTSRLRQFVEVRFDTNAYVKACIATAFMAISVLLLESIILRVYLIPAYVITGVVVYSVILKGLKAVTRDDLQLIKEALPNHLSFIPKVMETFFIPESVKATIDRAGRGVEE